MKVLFFFNYFIFFATAKLYFEYQKKFYVANINTFIKNAI